MNPDIQRGLVGKPLPLNNAGITEDMVTTMMSEADWDTSAHLKFMVSCSEAAIRHMVRKNTGRIVNLNMTSMAGWLGDPFQTNYCASKDGQIAYTKALAPQVAACNITVNAVTPGFVDKEFLSDTSPATLEAVLRVASLARKGTPEEIAYAVAFLASDPAAFLTGQVLGQDGGMAMMM
jgi:3-oxoacyl-[acyl-carrier protein] reductase